MQRNVVTQTKMFYDGARARRWQRYAHVMSRQPPLLTFTQTQRRCAIMSINVKPRNKTAKNTLHKCHNGDVKRAARVKMRKARALAFFIICRLAAQRTSYPQTAALFKIQQNERASHTQYTCGRRKNVIGPTPREIGEER